MPDIYSDAMREYYNLKQAEVVPLNTLEVTHPSFIDDLGNPLAIRVVDDYGTVIGVDDNGDDVYGHMLKLEDDAPLNAGEYVAFTGVKFDITLPPLEDGEPGSLRVGLDNAAGLLSDQFDAAVESRQPIGLNFREYLDNDPADPTGIYRGLSVGEADSTETRVVMSANYGDATNKSFPGIIYQLSQYPTLVR